MSKALGFSVYVTAFEKQRDLLEKVKGQNVPIFTSLHIAEEVSATYVEDVEKMCDWLHENDFDIMADVSPYTLERFGVDSLSQLAETLHLKALRLDFGFDHQQLANELKDQTFIWNASTTLGEETTGENSLYMHNFYPRPETGLDEAFFRTLNASIRARKGKVLAFMAGDKDKRGPIFEGLPTLEEHRFAAPYAQFVDLREAYGVDGVYLGDLNMTGEQLKLIQDYEKDQLLRLPIQLSKENETLYQQQFTVRVDSPSGLARVQESRAFAQIGQAISPKQIEARPRGAVTMDNEKYKRYSGEIQIMKKDYSADERVNVIGQIADRYLLLLKHLKNGRQFMFVPEN